MKIRIPTILALAVLAACLLPAAPAVPKMRLKLSTLAPTGSSYHQSLLRMGEAWKQASGGAVSVVIYPDGKLGGEADTVGLLEIGSIQGAMLTGIGLANITPDIAGLQSIPMLLRSNEELDRLRRSLQPRLEARLEEMGYTVLFWGDAGFVHFFSKVPVSGVDDMRHLKVYAPAGAPEQVEVFKKAGINTIPLETADIVSSLQTGLIDVTPAPAVFALATQIDRTAPYMLDFNWTPMVGAVVLRRSVWESFPEPVRRQFMEAAQRAGEEIAAHGRQEDQDAIAAMQKRGLQVIQLPDDKLREWRDVVENSYPLLRGTVVPADIYDETLARVQAWRAEDGAGD